MFISNNFHRNSSFNYKNPANKALRFGKNDELEEKIQQTADYLKETDNIDPEITKVVARRVFEVYGKQQDLDQETLVQLISESLQEKNKKSK